SRTGCSANSSSGAGRGNSPKRTARSPRDSQNIEGGRRALRTQRQRLFKYRRKPLAKWGVRGLTVRRRLAFAALAATTLFVSDALPWILPGHAQAQQQEFFLNVAPVMLAEPASKSPLPIQVGPQDALIRNSFVRIRGLPTAATLTEGHAISAGAW